VEILLPLKGERLAPDYGPWWTPRGVLWATGFRPFFLLAPALAVLLMPWWAAVLAGRVKAPTAFDPISWHAHEMLFGYAIAIIAGFLLTAVPKWTNRPIAEPKVVMALTGLWLAGRLAMNLPGLPTALVAVVDLAFLPALAWVVAKPIIGSRSRHNYAFVALLSLASLANLALHLRAAGLFSVPPRGLPIAVDAVTIVMLVVGGRIIPQFTGNRLRLDAQRSPRLAKASMGLVWALLAADVLGLHADLTRWLALAAGITVLLRMRGWLTVPALRVPMLWILHAGWAWIGVALVLRGLVGIVPGLAPTVSTHALTAGAIGALTLGMLARVSLGHTGRLIKATRSIAIAFVLVVAAALVRVLAPVLTPQHVVLAHGVAATAWALSMVLFLWRYALILVTPRADKKAG
jgi:uncharacterized protein involved in response to NO